METEDLEEFVEAIEGSLMEKGNPPEGVELPMAITNRQAEYLASVKKIIRLDAIPRRDVHRSGIL